MKRSLTGAIIISILYLTGCKNPCNDPKCILMDFYDALHQKDITGASKLVTVGSKDMLDMMKLYGDDSMGKKGDETYDKTKIEFGDAKIEGDKATVTVKNKTSTDSTGFILQNEGGDWKVVFEGDPKTVLLAFFSALNKKDMIATRKLATSESRSMLEMIEMGIKMGGDKDTNGKFDISKMRFGNARIEGDKATIPVKDKRSGEITNFSLKKEGGGWKVAFDKSSMLNIDPGKGKGMNIDSLLKNGMDK